MSGIEPRRASVPARGSGGAGGQPLARLAYTRPVTAVGWAAVPAEVARLLQDKAVGIGGEGLLATATQPVVKRSRRTGGNYQHLTGWWCSDERYVVFAARRALAEAGEGKLRPAGPWSVTGTIHEFESHGVAPVRSTWRSLAGGGHLPNEASPRTTLNPLEALPGGVAQHFQSSWSTIDAWVETAGRGHRETVMAAAEADGRVHLLKATRQAQSQEGLLEAAWETELLITRVGPARAFSVIGDAAPVRGALPTRRAWGLLPPGT